MAKIWHGRLLERGQLMGLLVTLIFLSRKKSLKVPNLRKYWVIVAIVSVAQTDWLIIQTWSIIRISVVSWYGQLLAHGH